MIDVFVDFSLLNDGDVACACYADAGEDNAMMMRDPVESIIYR